MQDILDVRGTRLHYIEDGSGPAIVLLHGNGMSASDFVASGLFDDLAQHHRVIAFDRPGFGSSTRPGSVVWSAAEQATLLSEAFERLEIDKPVVVGHSWGTLVAVALALDHPNDVGGLVLLSGYYYTTSRTSVFRTTAKLLDRTNIRRGADAVLRKMSATSIGDVVSWYGHATAAAGEAALMTRSAGAVEGRYGELMLPVTVVAGSDDFVVETLEQSVRFADAVRGAHLRIVPDAGHMVHHAAPDRVADAIRDVARQTITSRRCPVSTS